MILEKVVSGGQTGVDRAALDAAMARGLAVGGWCPRGRRAEDGTIPPRYPLDETPRRNYAQRTKWNVRDSDATLILTQGTPSGGTALTIRAAKHRTRPTLVIDLTCQQGPDQAVQRIVQWLEDQPINVLNVAGPRESSCPGITNLAYELLFAVFSQTEPSAP